MKPDELNAAEAERQTLLSQLQAAESALRSNLHRVRVDALARARMERALAHVREASSVIREISQVRTVDQLVHELQQVAQFRRRYERQLRQR